MTPTPTLTELQSLQERLAEAERAHRLQVCIHEAVARPIRERVTRAEDEYAATGMTWHLKALHIARRDLADLGPEPVEPIGIGLLKGRIARLSPADQTPTAASAAGRR